MPTKYILAIDQGTTGTRAILYSKKCLVASSAYQEFTQYYPKPGWVEHDPEEIWKSTTNVVKLALRKAKAKSSDVAAIGITNQRETTILWDRKTGKPLHRAIVWQDRRTASYTETLKKKGYETRLRPKTGLVLDPYFSGSKINWLLKNVPGLRAKAKQGRVCFGTIDSWLIWNLTGGESHVTDFTNASRTLLYNIRKKVWDPELLKMLGVPKQVLPRVQNAGSLFGTTVKAGPFIKGIPIYSSIGDQQAALYGQACYKAGQVKNTYGTGCFIVMNMGTKYRKPPFGLLTTLACDERGNPVYALEGAIFIAGAAIQWLRDGLEFFKDAKSTEAMAKSVKDCHGVTVIPALTGLGSPYWAPDVRGVISGLSRGVKKEHIVRATLESLGQQSQDVIDVMGVESGHKIRELRVDGGATKNRFLMQFQSDISGMPVLVSDLAESTAWGAAKLAGKMSGFWTNLRDVDRKRKYGIYKPRLRPSSRKSLRDHWRSQIRSLL